MGYAYPVYFHSIQPVGGGGLLLSSQAEQRLEGCHWSAASIEAETEFVEVRLQTADTGNRRASGTGQGTVGKPPHPQSVAEIQAKSEDILDALCATLPIAVCELNRIRRISIRPLLRAPSIRPFTEPPF